MSNLKHLSIDQLRDAKTTSLRKIQFEENRIESAKRTIAGQKERVRWINRYIDHKLSEQKETLPDEL